MKLITQINTSLGGSPHFVLSISRLKLGLDRLLSFEQYQRKNISLEVAQAVYTKAEAMRIDEISSSPSL